MSYQTTYAITIDGVRYGHKPEGCEIGAITRRLQQSGTTEVTVEELATAIKEGQTWMPSTYEPSKDYWGAFRGIRLWSLDFDNAVDETDDSGKKHKRQLQPGELGFVWPEQVRKRLVSLGLQPLLVHSTAHASKEAVRFRTVLDLGETLTDSAEAEEVVRLILSQFSEADQSCRNLNRLFFGACGCGLHPYWPGSEGWSS